MSDLSDFIRIVHEPQKRHLDRLRADRDALAADLETTRRALQDIAEWVRDGGHPDAPDDGEQLAVAVYERARAALAPAGGHAAGSVAAGSGAEE